MTQTYRKIRTYHDHTWHVLVATRNRNVGVVALRARHRLDRVGNQLAGLKRVTHASKKGQCCQYTADVKINRLPAQTGEKRGPIPSLPMVIPSDTPMVLNCQASMFCASTDFFTILPKSITVVHQLSRSYIYLSMTSCPMLTVCAADHILVSCQRSNLEAFGMQTHLQGLPSHHTVAMPT